MSRALSRAALALLLAIGLVTSSGCSRNEASEGSSQRLSALEERIRGLEERVKTLASSDSKGGDASPERMASLEKQFKDLDEAFSDLDLRWSKEIASLREDVHRLVSETATKRSVEELEKRATSDLGALKAELQAGGVTLLEKEGRIETTGSICQTEVLIEWLIVCRGGKTHEALAVVDCRPSLLNAAFIALGYKPGVGARAIPVAKDNPPGGTPISNDLVYYVPQGQRVHVYFEWRDGEKAVRRRPEESVLNSETGKPLESVGWVYLGSRFARLDSRQGDVFVADVTRDVVAIWHSFEGDAVLDNPGQDGMDDHIHFPITDKLPPKGTAIKVIFSREPL